MPCWASMTAPGLISPCASLTPSVLNLPSGLPFTKPSGGVKPPVGTVTISPVVGLRSEERV